MWTCTKCSRIFSKAKQPHSCQKIPLEQHFKNKEKAKGLFEGLVKQINKKVGQCQIISLSCCVHLFGSYEFLAILPKKNSLEIRFGLDRILESPRLKQSVPLSSKYYKNCIEVNSSREINQELMGWIQEAYHLKDK